MAPLRTARGGRPAGADRLNAASGIPDPAGQQGATLARNPIAEKKGPVVADRAFEVLGEDA